MTMKKYMLFAAALLATALVNAQQPDYLRQLQDNPAYLFGTDYLCPTGPSTLTPAPAGYAPFYISHYGRHGARYAWQDDLYSSLNDRLTQAEAEGNLTPLGQDYKRRFDQLYPSVRYRTGDLSRKGWQQQQELAARMYANTPEVFTDDAKVRAWVSTSTRCVMTMSSFCLGLKGMNPKLDIFENFGYSFLPAILPLNDNNPFKRSVIPQTPLKFDETWEQYIERTVDYRAILQRLFQDVDKAVAPEKQWDLVSYLYFFAAGMESLDTDLSFNDLFTPEERIALWKIDDFQFYFYAWPDHLGYQPIVEDIVEKAEARIAAGEKGADLRFGHDYTFLPLLMCLGVNGYDHSVERADEIPVWCRLHDVPMGANLHFIFYRGKPGQEILFKVLLNGQEARLPLKTDNWPYYSWDAFKRQAYQPIACIPAEAEIETITTTVPEVSGLCPSPDGHGFLAASDEKGVYSVTWSGKTATFYTESSMDCEGVTLDPQTGDVYYIVEGTQEVRRLAAPNYAKSERICRFRDIGYRTNRGLEGITWYKDGMLLIGNQRKPVQLICYSLTDGIVWRKDLTGVSEIADLCYDPVRDVLWIADSELRTLNRCTPEGEVQGSWPIPFIDNGEGLWIDHENSCIWVGDDTTSRIYKIPFGNL